MELARRAGIETAAVELTEALGKDVLVVERFDRAGGEASQAMAIDRDGYRLSQVAACVDRSSTYLLTEAEAREIVGRQVETIENEWDDVCELARLSEVDRRRLWHGAFLNPYATDGY